MGGYSWNVSWKSAFSTWSAFICRRLRATVGLLWASMRFRVQQRIIYFLKTDSAPISKLVICFLLILSFHVCTEVYNGKPNSNKTRSFHPQNFVLCISKLSCSPLCFRFFLIYIYPIYVFVRFSITIMYNVENYLEKRGVIIILRLNYFVQVKARIKIWIHLRVCLSLDHQGIQSMKGEERWCSRFVRCYSGGRIMKIRK
jgi:hypothetical protein